MVKGCPFRYLAVTDRSVCPEPLPDRIARLLDLGVPAVQIREKSQTDRRLFGWIRSLPPCKTDRVLINSRVDIAVLTSLAGVHRSTRAISAAMIRRVAQRPLIVGASTHGLWEVRNAQKFPLDYLTFGPVFPTPSKPELPPEDLPGPEGLRRACEISEIPILALGGVMPDRVPACLDAGAFGVAGIRALMGPENPAEAWQRIERALSRSGTPER